MTPPDIATNHEPSANEIDVVPLQRAQLADAQTGSHRHGEHRPPLDVGCREKPLAFVEVEEVELRQRPFEPLHLRYEREQLPVHSDQSNFRKMMKWLLTDFGESPVASLRAL
jgi:hypothetical protein